MKKLAVVGLGQMGLGIAQVAAQAGLEVVGFDANPQAFSKAKASWEKSLAKLAEKKLLQEDVAMVLGRIKAASSLEQIKEFAPDIVVEAVAERFEIKKDIFEKLASLVSEKTILASNTSSISLTKIAACVKNPDRVIGMHFMNPVPLMKLVEVINGLETSEATFQTTKALAERMGKTVVVSRDMPGFIVNRILMPMINEACFALNEGIATVEDIDTAMKLGTNQPMGPLQLADFIGLDTCLSIMEVLHEGLGDSKYRPSPLLKQYVTAGRLGKKSGRGFFEYNA